MKCFQRENQSGKHSVYKIKKEHLNPSLIKFLRVTDACMNLQLYLLTCKSNRCGLNFGKVKSCVIKAPINHLEVSLAPPPLLESEVP